MSARGGGHPVSHNGGEFDVVVVGFGCAGACAAIEAADAGASVLIIERFDGGGATRRSGGVIYAGGGTATQEAAGVSDTPSRMFRYLRRETEGAVSDTVLRDFCRESRANLEWLCALGLAVPARCWEAKTTQPPAGYGLYYSGNERQYGGAGGAVPRGHVPGGMGMGGPFIHAALSRAVAARGIEVRQHTWAVSLTRDGRGAVTGVEAQTLARRPLSRGLRAALFGMGMASRGAAALMARIERRRGEHVRITARRGVIITAGGFSFNRAMMELHAPAYARSMPLGTPGDDGSGISLGLEAGAAAAHLESCAASRFYAPPLAFTTGIMVDGAGRRLCDESLYGATLSRHIAAAPGGCAWLVVDRAIMKAAADEMRAHERVTSYSLRDILAGQVNYLIFRRMNAVINRRLNRIRAATMEDLARRLGMDPAVLTATMDDYNRDTAAGRPDKLGKDTAIRRVIANPPFYAIDVSLGNRLFLDPCMTLGGLRVDHTHGRVLRHDSSPIPGLYAAGRSAAGICARSYVSGLSLADCIAMGRRAGRAAAGRRG